MPALKPGVSFVFDLDGTISNPAPGIARCLNYSLRESGFPEVEESEIARFIGPPIDDTFRELTGATTPDLLAEMVGRFRDRYGRIGYAENTLYPGIPEALHHLTGYGFPLGICTTKRTDFAEQVLQFFGLRRHFSFVSGGDIGITKEDQFRSLLQNGTIGRNAVMIGDRATDINAAHACGICSVGVLWGFGSRQEIRNARPDRILEWPEELMDLVADTDDIDQRRRRQP